MSMAFPLSDDFLYGSPEHAYAQVRMHNIRRYRHIHVTGQARRRVHHSFTREADYEQQTKK